VRTTLTLDDDVAALVQDEARRTGMSFKGTINDLLRRGIVNGKSHKKDEFVVEPLFHSVRPAMNYDKVSALIEELDGPYYR
jgi:hypothetical protein